MESNNNGSGNEGSTDRWTCEACGCNTNPSTTQTCSICGTSSGSSILRRAGYAARAGLFARGLSGRRDGAGDHSDLADLWGRVVDGVGGLSADDGDVMAALAMEVAGNTSGRNRESSRQRLLEAARTFSLSGRDTAPTNPRDLMQAATDNAANFSPRWVSPSQIGGRANITGNGIQVEGDTQNVAHLPIGAGEGRAVRASEHIPRTVPFSALVSPSRSPDRRHRRCFGFRVAFDHHDREAGQSLGGCYLVGVTTSSFNNFGERNGLQQSPLFWGVEDSSKKYEGSRYNRGNTARGGRGEISSYGSPIPPGEAPMNANGVLFGTREVVTVVVDVETRAMTLWRDEQLLGTLVSNLPRGSSLYPVAVPFNVGAMVAITGMDGDPLQKLRNFASGSKQAQQEKNKEIKMKLLSVRSILMLNGKPTGALVAVLRTIFASYATGRASDECVLSRVEGARLWYRCGMKLATVDSLFEANSDKKGVNFDDFLQIINRVIQEEEERDWSGVGDVRKGDKVQLVAGYESKGDAASGPLQPGDRGSVVELQKGPNGQSHSVRVLFGGRRWWYQPQAVVSERSGLIESSAVWWLHKLLRAHGFDHSTLTSFVGNPVTSSSWEYGDWVVTRKKASASESSIADSDRAVGRIIPITGRQKHSISTLAGARSDRQSVLVEFADERFRPPQSRDSVEEAETYPMKSARFRVSDLVHSTPPHEGPLQDGKPPALGDSEMDSQKKPVAETVSATMKKDIGSLRKLNVAAIESITKDCKRNSGSLATWFAAGLPEAIIVALDGVDDKQAITKSKFSPMQIIDALGGLVLCVAKFAFAENMEDEFHDNDDSPNGSGLGEDTMDESGGEATSRRAASSAFEGAEEYSDERSLTDAARSGRLSTLQERRSVLLALMSRARRTTGSLNELAAGENDSLAGLRQAIPGLGTFRHSSAAELFHDGHWDDFFGLSGGDASASISAARENIAAALSREREESQPQPGLASNPSEDEERNTYLWSILQGSAGSMKPSPGRDATRLFVGSLARGLLGDSLAWTKAVVETQCRSRKANQSSILRTAADEDGIPVLQLAIQLGCRTAILNFLIQCGAQVSEKELVMAASSDQSETLRLLLQHTTYSEGLLDLGQCSPEVCDVVKQACIFQDSLKERMNEQLGEFFIRVLRRLLHLGLVCRYCTSNASHLLGCGETVMNTLSGFAMLRALQQPRGRPAADARRHDATTQLPASLGLLKVMPTRILVEALLMDVCHMTTFLLLIEDHLYSKNSSDAAVGLTLLLLMLEKLPFMGSSSEIHRFGFEDLVASQESIASGRLAEYSNLEVPNDEGQSNNLLDPSSQQACILCPAKHVAVLHITRHSSFRCDLCGKGVERGRPMHGCRECDWDACFECTDKKVGYIKQKVVKQLSKSCRAIFCKQTNSDEALLESIPTDECLAKLSSLDNTADVRNLAICLQQREGSAIRRLSTMLQQPGQVTMHQFHQKILPSLHASLLGNGSESERQTHRGGSGHKNKKARTVGEHGKLEADVVKCLLNTSQVLECLRGGQAPDAGGDVGNGTGSEKAEVANDSKQGSVNGNPDIVRRIHKVLSFHETVSTTNTSTAGKNVGSVARGALKSLTQPMTLTLWPSTFENYANTVNPSSVPLTVKAEPLISIDDIELHVLRTCKFNMPGYASFCERLALDNAVIVEQARSGRSKKWKVGRVTSYNAAAGWHYIQYALAWKGQGSENEACLEVNGAETESLRNLQFAQAETRLILAAREYYILGRNIYQSDSRAATPCTFGNDNILSGRGTPDAMDIRPSTSVMPTVGSRVEMTGASSLDRQHSHTVLAVDNQTGQCVLVSDSGEVSMRPSEQVVAAAASTNSASERSANRSRQERDPFARGFPFLSARSHLSELSRRESERSSSTPKQVGVIKRTWSALSLTESMRPIELSSRDAGEPAQDKFIPGRGLLLCCDHGVLLVDQASIEVPPLIRVEFSTRETLPTFDMQAKRGLPLVGALKQLRRLAEDPADQGCPIRVTNSLYYAVKTEDRAGNMEDKLPSPVHPQFRQPNIPGSCPRGESDKHETWMVPNNRTRKLPISSHFGGEDEQEYGGLCEGLDETCVQCMEVLGFLSEFSEDSKGNGNKAGMPTFENFTLSKKLADELDDPLTVVGGALPDWCVIAPTFAPRMFSYASRRLLLERSAFGVSRSTLKQQEAKVNVGRLRQRMASLRGRAVELVGEAFSGGAEDPTALQLQADELYGMEESLANRVKAAFRAEQWEEHALEVAKAAVGRDQLLSDAEKIMEKIAKADSICGRRLEVRFENESGFDAAAGDEAGVTRGFYADVAEALLSCDNVSGVHCNPACSSSASINAMETDDSENEKPALTMPLLQRPCELPMFIPDTDSSSRVIIPTPRSDPNRGIPLVGVFPRPLSFQHPQFGEVLLRYKFMGRLFATAMRDGFMFPLPLSASFLKLVQRCGVHEPSALLRKNDLARYYKGSLGHGWDDKVKGSSSMNAPILDSADLPRPGFLGGEIYAAETHVCRALDRIDGLDPPLGQKEIHRRYEEIATDKSFARVALGKAYDCSFEDYFQDKTFVDPLDPTQGPDATPLCVDGYKKSVTINNIREWVSLSKQFFLHDGVIAQACAFRSGVDDFFSAEYLRLFTPEELQRDVCGIGDNVDRWEESDVRELLKLDGGKGAAEALAAVAAVGGGGGATLSRRFSSSSPTINYLVKALLGAKPKQRRQFLSFVTSVPIVTPGKIEVVPIVSAQGEFQPMQDPGCLPRANTCARRLYLPKFEDYERFAQVLWAVVKEESRFKGFYEWRN